MTSGRSIGLAALGIALVTTQAVAADVSIGAFSQTESVSRARIGGSVSVGYEKPGSSGSTGSLTASTYSGGGAAESNGSTSGGYRYPTLSSDAAILSNPTPEGPGTFWFQIGGGQRCIYNSASNGQCYNVAGPGAAAPRARPVDPRVLAEIAARRLPLLPGEIDASPSQKAAGLTGAPSWFWLNPRPAVQELTVTQGAERVSVTAVPSSVVWDFGDGDQADAGPGRPFAVGSGERQGSVRHRYRTRCLPGDRGRDPYVLASCTADGYEVGARVEWTVTFVATGPIEMSGSLPSRTTATTLAYPVGEVRGFLARRGAHRSGRRKSQGIEERPFAERAAQYDSLR